MNSPLASTPSIASRTRGNSGSYCAFTSTSGIGRTARKSRSSPAQNQIGHDRHDSGDHRVIHKAEVMVERLVAFPKAPADTGERKTPDRRPDQRQDRVAPERHAEDAGRNGVERPNDGSQPPHQNREVAPTLEPAL